MLSESFKEVNEDLSKFVNNNNSFTLQKRSLA
jgi:hypothetical protein